VSRGKTLVGTEIVLVLGLVAFVGAMAGLDNFSGKGSPVNLGPLTAIAFALIRRCSGWGTSTFRIDTSRSRNTWSGACS